MSNLKSYFGQISENLLMKFVPIIDPIDTVWRHGPSSNFGSECDIGEGGIAESVS